MASPLRSHERLGRSPINQHRLGPVDAAAPAAAAGPEYTEYGIKLFPGYRLSVKLPRRSSSRSSSTSDNHNNNDDSGIDFRPRSADRGRRGGTRRAASSGSAARRRQSRASSVSASSVADSLRLLDLDSNAGSRRPVVVQPQQQQSQAGTRSANWEFEVF